MYNDLSKYRFHFFVIAYKQFIKNTNSMTYKL